MPQLSFPIFKGAIYNTTKAGDIDFFASDLLPSTNPTTFLIYYFPNSGGDSIFPRLKRTNGTNIIVEDFSGSFDVNFSLRPIMFQTIIAPGDSINFIFPTGTSNGKIGTLIVLEIETTPQVFIANTHG